MLKDFIGDPTEDDLNSMYHGNMMSDVAQGINVHGLSGRDLFDFCLARYRGYSYAYLFEYLNNVGLL